MPSTLEIGEDPKLGLAAEMLHRRGSVQLTAWGTSMLPSLWPGDLLTIQSVAPGEVVPGDIVLVLRDGRFFIHRLVEMQPEQDCFWFVTRGDAMPQKDPPAAASELLGRVAWVRRDDRNFVPRRQVARHNSALAWMLCRSDRLRSLTLRVHAARMKACVTHP